MRFYLMLGFSSTVENRVSVLELFQTEEEAMHFMELANSHGSDIEEWQLVKLPLVTAAEALHAFMSIGSLEGGANHEAH